MKINVGDLLKNGWGDLGMVEGIAPKLTNNTEYMYWVYWFKEALEAWATEDMVRTYRNIYIRSRE